MKNLKIFEEFGGTINIPTAGEILGGIYDGNISLNDTDQQFFDFTKGLGVWTKEDFANQFGDPNKKLFDVGDVKKLDYGYYDYSFVRFETKKYTPNGKDLFGEVPFKFILLFEDGVPVCMIGIDYSNGLNNGYFIFNDILVFYQTFHFEAVNLSTNKVISAYGRRATLEGGDVSITMESLSRSESRITCEQFSTGEKKIYLSSVKSWDSAQKPQEESITESIHDKNHFKKTSWSRKRGKRNVKVTIDEVIRFLDHMEVETIRIPIQDLLPISIHRDGKISEESHKRAMESRLSFPIIVTMKGGQLDMILDGNHRLLKSKILGFETIEVRILDLDNCPKKFRYVFS